MNPQSSTASHVDSPMQLFMLLWTRDQKSCKSERVQYKFSWPFRTHKL